VENAFDLLEQRVRRAAEVIRRLQGENAELKKQLGRAQAALQQAEKAAAAAAKQKGSAEDGRRLEGLTHEVDALRKEREEIRGRIAKLVNVLEGLEE
jgi:predicted  nucleic acid-binding Zn-ribbon protein